MQTTAHLYVSIQMRSSDIIFQPILLRHCNVFTDYTDVILKVWKKKIIISNNKIVNFIISNTKYIFEIFSFRSLWNEYITKQSDFWLQEEEFYS